ncbi:hypothetical protein ACIQMJ_32905 [Actinosynnema sp. NPDC091369]
MLDVVDPDGLTGTDEVVDVLRAAGTVGRRHNPDLWDALVTSIIRQVIRAGQARKLYRTFCEAHGEEVLTPHGPAWLFPTPEAALALPDDEFTDLEMAFKRRPLKPPPRRCWSSARGHRAPPDLNSIITHLVVIAPGHGFVSP